jgi:hypothetical protein
MTIGLGNRNLQRFYHQNRPSPWPFQLPSLWLPTLPCPAPTSLPLAPRQGLSRTWRPPHQPRLLATPARRLSPATVSFSQAGFSQAGQSKAQRWAAPSPSSSTVASSLGLDRAGKVRSKVVVLSHNASTSHVMKSVAKPIVHVIRMVLTRGCALLPRPIPDVNGWTQVVSRCRQRPAEHVPRRLVPVDLRGRCFNCLGFSHRAAECCKPPRCFRCRLLGHRVAACPDSCGSKPSVMFGPGKCSVWDRLGPRAPETPMNCAKHRSVWDRLGSQSSTVPLNHLKKRLEWRRVLSFGKQVVLAHAIGGDELLPKGRHRRSRGIRRLVFIFWIQIRVVHLLPGFLVGTMLSWSGEVCCVQRINQFVFSNIPTPLPEMRFIFKNVVSDDGVALGKHTSQIINQMAQIRPRAQAHESLKKSD